MDRTGPEIEARTAAGLPVPMHTSDRRTFAAPSAPEAEFLSQMIAERDRMAPQRRRRRAPLDAALSAYAAGEISDEARLPLGFFRSRVA